MKLIFKLLTRILIISNTSNIFCAEIGMKSKFNSDFGYGRSFTFPPNNNLNGDMLHMNLGVIFEQETIQFWDLSLFFCQNRRRLLDKKPSYKFHDSFTLVTFGQGHTIRRMTLFGGISLGQSIYGERKKRSLDEYIYPDFNDYFEFKYRFASGIIFGARYTLYQDRVVNIDAFAKLLTVYTFLSPIGSDDLKFIPTLGLNLSFNNL